MECHAARFVALRKRRSTATPILNCVGSISMVITVRASSVIPLVKGALDFRFFRCSVTRTCSQGVRMMSSHQRCVALVCGMGGSVLLFAAPASATAAVCHCQPPPTTCPPTTVILPGPGLPHQPTTTTKAVVTMPPTTAPPATKVPPTVPTSVVFQSATATPPVATLPFTGSNTLPAAVGGLTLLAIGAGTLRSGRRREQ